MNPREFKSTLDSTLESICTRLGFTREKSATSRWMLLRGKEYLFYEIAKGVKNPFIPGLGGRFQVRIYSLSVPDFRKASYENGISFLKYFTDEDLEKLKDVRNSVLEKLMSQGPSVKLSELDLEVQKPLWEMEMRRGVLRQQPPQLRYVDREDLLAWGEFLAARLEQTVRGIFSSSDRSFV